MVFYDELIDVFGATWLLVMLALEYFEIGNSLEFSFKSCLFGKWNTYKVSVI